MDGGKCNSPVVELGHGMFNGRRNIKELEINHYLVTSGSKPIDNVKPAGHEKLQTHLVESDMGLRL